MESGESFCNGFFVALCGGSMPHFRESRSNCSQEGQETTLEIRDRDDGRKEGLPSFLSSPDIAVCYIMVYTSVPLLGMYR